MSYEKFVQEIEAKLQAKVGDDRNVYIHTATKKQVDIIMKKATKQRTCDRRFSTLSTGFSTGKNRKTPGKTGVFWRVIVVCTVVFHNCGKYFSLQNTVKTPLVRRKRGYARQLHLSATQGHPRGKDHLG